MHPRLFLGKRAFTGFQHHAPKVAMLLPLPACNSQFLACRAQLQLGAKQCSPMRRQGLRQSRQLPSRRQLQHSLLLQAKQPVHLCT